jgi:hypothetical protein
MYRLPFVKYSSRLPLENVLLHVRLEKVPLPPPLLLPGEQAPQKLAHALQHVHVVFADVVHDAQAVAVNLGLLLRRLAPAQDVGLELLHVIDLLLFGVGLLDAEILRGTGSVRPRGLFLAPLGGNPAHEQSKHRPKFDIRIVKYGLLVVEPDFLDAVRGGDT